MSTPFAPIASPADTPPPPRAAPLDSSNVGIRELMAVREIAHAFLTANDTASVQQFALDRVSPLVGATFACVYLVDADSDSMRLAAVHNWPERWARFLGAMRVRVGSGPSGTAASERRMVEVPDVFADASLRDWQEVATELGFRSLVALPLQTAAGVHGAVAFYFAAAGALSVETRQVLQVVADQLAATVEKTHLIEGLRGANAALRESHAELEQQYAAVVEARRLQNEFLTNVSHELRTPLTAVLGYLSLLEEGVVGPVTAEQQETLDEVRRASERLLELIGDLLELTALKRGELPVQAADFDPRDPLREAIAQANGRKPNVQLVVQDGQALSRMVSDKKKIVRVLSILLGNAFKFTEAGEVRVEAETGAGTVRYRVRDTGVGVSPDAQAFIFDEFRQEDGSATRRYGGSGLGLAIARRLARRLGGDVTVSSEPGKGSSFTLEVPLVMPTASQLPAASH